MKSYKHVLLALVSSLLLTVGLAKAAESFDTMTTSSQVEQVQDGIPGVTCIILH